MVENERFPSGARTSWLGELIDATTIIGKYTYFGDANIDGQVTSDDYVVVDLNLGQHNGTAQWTDGDLAFPFDGYVTSDDYVAIDLNLGKGQGDPL